MQPDDEMVAAFARDGVACVRQVLDPGEVAAAAATIGAGPPAVPVVWPADSAA
jgi:hypothetical protein